MATQLPTTYLDPILDSSVNTKKLFKLTNQTTKEEMTVTIEDITTYLQIASTIGAGAFNTQNQVINSKLTADALVGKLTEVLALTQPGSVADALVLKEMNANFQAGCSKIASAITANGVSTASNASPTAMATNIGTVATNKYNAGYSTGHNAGYAVGYSTGYNAGYAAGYRKTLLATNIEFGWYARSVNITCTGLSNYAQLTTTNFVLDVQSLSWLTNPVQWTSNSVSRSYNASTGILNVSTAFPEGSIAYKLYCNVYAIH